MGVTELPTEAIQAAFPWGTQRFLMIGQAGIGKSEFWAQDPGALFLETEAGLGHLTVKRVPCLCWDDLRDVYGLLVAQQQKGAYSYSTVVVDTVDRMIAMAQEEVINRAQVKYKDAIGKGLAINTIGDVPNGAGWFLVSQAIANFLKKLEGLPSATVLVGHIQDKQVEEPTRKYNRTTINIGGQLGSALLGWPDHTMNLQARLVGTELRRQVRTLPMDTIEAKSHGGRIPDKMGWGPDAKANFNALRALFD